MPAARIACLSLIVMLFAAAWSNDKGLHASPLPDRGRILATPSAQPVDPSAEPATPRSKIAEAGENVSYSSEWNKRYSHR